MREKARDEGISGVTGVTKETQGLERKCAARDFVSVQGFGIYSTQKRSYKIFFLSRN